MSDQLNTLIREAQKTGTLTNLPKKMFIDGQWVEAFAGNRMETFDPGTGAAFTDFSMGSAEDVEVAIASSNKAFELWRQITPAERGSIMLRSASLIRENSALLAVVESMDSGKSVAEARGDIAGCARLMEYYAGAADKIQGDTIPLGPDYLSCTYLEPVGVTAHIVPWNYPSSTMIRGIAPALAAARVDVAIVVPAAGAVVAGAALAVGPVVVPVGVVLAVAFTLTARLVVGTVPLGLLATLREP